MGTSFRATRGLRLGDPLNPFLFLICSESLSILMRLAVRENKIFGARASRNGPQISHLLFTNDCVLIGEATTRGANVLKGILFKYEVVFGQCVNFDKSTVFFSKNILEST